MAKALLLYIASMLVTVGCGQGMHSAIPDSLSNSESSIGGGGGGGGGTPVGKKGFAAFQSGFYAFTQSQGCVMCHGNQQNPLFAIADVNTAYLNAKPLLNLAAPTTSIFVTYAGNSHCGAAPCSDSTVSPHVADLMTAWAAGEMADAQGSGGGTTPPPSTTAAYLTTNLAMPVKIPLITASATPAILRFKLQNVKAGVVALNNANAMIEVEIQMLSATEYRIGKPKILGNTAPVTVTGIHVYLRASTDTGVGSEDQSQGMAWDDLSATAATYTTTPPATTPAAATPLTTETIQAAVISTMDVMTIGFDDLQ